MRVWRTFSSKETERLGASFMGRVRRGRGAAVVALRGPLGSGKTTFVRGFLRALGVARAQSPTFILIRRTPLRRRPFRNVFHVDAYRLKRPGEFRSLGLSELVRDPNNLILIEWAEHIERVVPKEATWLTFRHGKKENERVIHETSSPH